MLFLASHAVPENVHPIFEFKFEKGLVTFDSSKDRILYGTPDGGETKAYGNPFDDEMRKIFTCIRAIRGEEEVPCDIDAASPQLITINAVSEHNTITEVPEEFLIREKKMEETGETILIHIKGIKDTFMECYEKGMLPSELGVPWAESQGSFEVEGYTEFKGVK
jgi:hypothetical protein